MRKTLLKFLLNPLTIILSFLIIALAGIFGLIFFREFAQDQSLLYDLLLKLKLLSFVVYSIIAYFAYKSIKLMRWLMALIILLTGLHAAAMGLFTIEGHQYLMKPFFVVSGIYFIFGGIVLFRSRKQFDEKEFLTNG